MHVTGDAYQKFYLLCQYYAQCFLMPIMLQIMAALSAQAYIHKSEVNPRMHEC